MTQAWNCYIQNEIMVILKSSILILSLIMITMQELAAEFGTKCPDTLDKKYRAGWKCPNDTVHYHCLRYGSNHCLPNGSTANSVEEKCMTPQKYQKGIKLVYCGNLDAEKCSKERFSPEFIWTNEGDKCPYLKSNCGEEGQVIVSNEKSDMDSWCRCDYTRGYDYITPPKDRCKCKQQEEDCACYIKQCGNDNSLSQDYNCSQRNTRHDNVVCPEINTQRNQEVETPKIMKVSPENTKKGKYKGSSAHMTWSYPNGHQTPDHLQVIILVVISVTIITIVIMTVLKAFPAETKKSSKRPKRLFHQLNDMIVVRRFQYVHQLDEIETINNDKKIRIIILIGQTGAGKTQSAYWVCRKAQSKYSVIVKLSASNRADFVTSLKNFAINLNLGLPHEEDDMKIIESISSTIVTYLNNVSKESGLKNMFLVLIDDVHVDNAVNDSETTLSKMVSKTILLLSEVNTLKLIITTTNPMLFDDCCLDYKEVIFVGMIPTECVSFLKRSEHFKEETNEDIENLIKNIGCLPITINSARKFMIQHKMHIKKYIKLYEKLKDADNENITEVVNCQKIPVEYIKNGLDGPSWEVITLLPYLDYNSIHQELVEACCHHICKDETKAEIIIGRFREYSLCQYDKIPRLRVFSTDDSQEDRIISFHSETMLTLKLIDKNHNNKKTTDRHKLFVLLKMFCFEIDLDARIDTTLERNLLFLNHARCVLRLFAEGVYDLNENEKVYMSYINYLLGKTILYQGTDIPLAHKHLMKSRKLCLEFVEEDSDLTINKCPHFATKKGTGIEEVPIMQQERVTGGYASLRSKTLDLDFVKEFVLSKRRNKRDIYVLQQEGGREIMRKSNYLSEKEYQHLTSCKPKLAMPLESLCKTFLSELMLHILHDDGKALDELMSGSETYKHVKRACVFEVDTYKELNSLIQSEEELKDFPLLRYLSIKRGEQDITVHQCTLDEIKSHIDNLKTLLQNQYLYFEFGVVKTLSNNFEHHYLSCYRLLIKCIIKKHKLSNESEKDEILIEGRKYVKLLCEILSKIETDENAVKWVEIPKFYNQCAHFLQLSGRLNDQHDLRHAVELYGKAIEIEENRQAYITRFLLEGYHGKVNCLLILNMETDAKRIFDKLKNTLPKSSEFLIKMEALFSKKDN